MNKSALAFFFLFFLHGTSIGNGQQGISYNVFGLCVRFCLAESSILSTNVNGKTCTKPVLTAGTVNSAECLIETIKKSF